MEFGKKKGMSPIEKKAKMNVLKDLNGQSSKLISDGLKKVTVASDSKEGLKAGLDKAEEIIGENDSEDSEKGIKADDQAEGYEDQQDSAEPMSEDEIDAKIKELLAIKEKLNG